MSFDTYLSYIREVQRWTSLKCDKRVSKETQKIMCSYFFLFWHIFVVLQRNPTLDLAEVRQMCVKSDTNTSKQHFKTKIYKSLKIYKRDALKMRQIYVKRNMNTPKQHFKSELCSSTETYKRDVLKIQKRRIEDATNICRKKYEYTKTTLQKWAM